MARDTDISNHCLCITQVYSMARDTDISLLVFVYNTGIHHG